MKHPCRIASAFRGLAFALAVLVASQTSFADAPKKWSDLAEYLKGKYLAVTTRDGKTIRGRFVETREDAIVLDNGAQIEIPRASFAWIGVERTNLSKLGKNLKDGYSRGFHDLFSPMGPWGIVEVPAITVYAVIAAPLSALGDLFHNRRNSSDRIFIQREPAKIH
jgi:hypothetical protein